MNKEFYEELKELEEIFDSCTVNGEEVLCFQLIKKIVDGEVIKEDISEEQKLSAKKQLVEALEWLYQKGVMVEYQKELMEVID